MANKSQQKLLQVQTRHTAMVLDPLRTLPLAKAIAAKVKPGERVLDLGTGLGLLAFLACRAGAKQVYAIDVDRESLELARFYAKRFGFEDRITFLEGLSYELELKERVDLVICEVIGSLGFDENILAALFDAQKHLLKKRGEIIPEKIELFGAPYEKQKIKTPQREKLQWSDVCGFDFSLPGTVSISSEEALYAFRGVVTPDMLLSPPKKLTEIDTSTSLDVGIEVKVPFLLERNGTLDGIAIWPRITWMEGALTDASPEKEETHWGQGILEVPSKKVVADEKKNFHLIIQPHPDHPQQQTEVLWRLT